MDLVDLLNSNQAELPLVGDVDLEAQLQQVFGTYAAEVAKLTSSDRATAAVRTNAAAIGTLSSEIIESLSAWLDGLPEIAIRKLDIALTSVSSAVGKLASQPVGPAGHGPLFRMRTAELNARFTSTDLFHIPFEKRDLVATQRYSFPGLPCLYFGRSMYVCWEEFGRPDLASLWVTKFQLRSGETLRVLDLGYRPAFMAAMLRANAHSASHADLAAAYATLWPLIAACSIRRRPGTGRGFVVEYVLPQLLLRWVIRRQRNPEKDPIGDLDGIRYFSTHIDDYKVEVAGMNYVFPAQTRTRTGYCSVLRSKFCMTPPVNWQIATAGNQAPPVPTYNNVTFELTPGWPVDYRSTVFSRVEGFLDQLPHGPVP